MQLERGRRVTLVGETRTHPQLVARRGHVRLHGASQPPLPGSQTDKAAAGAKGNTGAKRAKGTPKSAKVKEASLAGLATACRAAGAPDIGDDASGGDGEGSEGGGKGDGNVLNVPEAAPASAADGTHVT